MVDKSISHSRWVFAISVLEHEIAVELKWLRFFSYFLMQLSDHDTHEITNLDICRVTYHRIRSGNPLPLINLKFDWFIRSRLMILLLC